MKRGLTVEEAMKQIRLNNGEIQKVSNDETESAWAIRHTSFVNNILLSEFKVKAKELDRFEKAMCMPGRKSQYQHILWCCDIARTMAHELDATSVKDRAKLYRWIGFAQGYAWSTSCISLADIIESRESFSVEPLKEHIDGLNRAIAYIVNELNRPAKVKSDGIRLSDDEMKSLWVDRKSRELHVRWMLGEIASMGPNKFLEANQWLGFIQGYGFSVGLWSIDSLRDSVVI